MLDSFIKIGSLIRNRKDRPPPPACEVFQAGFPSFNIIHLYRSYPMLTKMDLKLFTKYVRIITSASDTEQLVKLLTC